MHKFSGFFGVQQVIDGDIIIHFESFGEWIVLDANDALRL
jgi:hypothetical protein